MAVPSGIRMQCRRLFLIQVQFRLLCFFTTFSSCHFVISHAGLVALYSFRFQVGCFLIPNFGHILLGTSVLPGKKKKPDDLAVIRLRLLQGSQPAAVSRVLAVPFLGAWC